MITHASLFSGFGGFDIAAQWLNWLNLFHCEINPFCNHLLKYHFPNAESFTDIKSTDFTKYRNKVTVLTGGFPCQPYSVAGKRQGKNDERHLWPEMLRAIREIQPPWVVGENVRGIVNWNKGLVFNEVQTDLEAEGYEVQPFILPAASINAPHERYRTWFIAYSHKFSNLRTPRQRSKKSESQRLQNWHNLQQSILSAHVQQQTNTYTNRQSGKIRNTSQTQRTQESDQLLGQLFGIPHDANAPSKRLHKRGAQNNGQTENTEPNRFTPKTESVIANTHSIGQPRKEHRQNETRQPSENGPGNFWANFPTQSPFCGGNDGLSFGLDNQTVFNTFQPGQKKVSFSKWRNQSIKGFGNAIVPQLALQIFEVINTMENA